MTVCLKIKTCEVGLFKLPGVVIDRPEDVSDETWNSLLIEVELWSTETNCGKRMT